MQLLTDAEIRARLATLPGWELEGSTIRRRFTFADFNEAMGFVNRVALAAEKAFHHPDIDIRWNEVSLALSTHSEGGLTAKDTDLAATIDGMV